MKRFGKKYRETGRRKDWETSNPDKLKIYAENHRKHEIKPKEWNNCKNYFNNECAYCRLPKDKHFVKFRGKIILSDFHREHVDDEGSNGLDNCIPSCKSCNTSKRKAKLEDWYPQQEFYTEERYDKIQKWRTEDYKLYLNCNPIKQ